MKLTRPHFSKLNGKKRYLVMGFLALEMMSLPAAAQIVQRVAFSPNPIVTAVEIPTAEPGLSRFLVTSNAEFSVQAANGNRGTINTLVHVSGTLAGMNRFGDAAQLPGPKRACARINGPATHIYSAKRKTAAENGTAPEQAVVFEFRYAKDSQPSFEFVAGNVTPKPIIKCDLAVG